MKRNLLQDVLAEMEEEQGASLSAKFRQETMKKIDMAEQKRRRREYVTMVVFSGVGVAACLYALYVICGRTIFNALRSIPQAFMFSFQVHEGLSLPIPVLLSTCFCAIFFIMLNELLRRHFRSHGE